jgi:outer membrane protein OmpA-like peptidoglycan-associated protein
MKFRIALLAATVFAAPFALPHAAKAQPVTGLYVAGGIGYNLQESQKAKDIYAGGEGVRYDARLTTHNGYTGEGSIGYGLGNGFRFEIEGDYFENRFDKAKLAGDAFPAGGRNRQFGAFANALYDFDVGVPYLYPYVGGGVGYQESYFDNLDFAGASFTKERGSLAYQGIAGISFPIPGAPGLSATAEYRFTALANSRKFDGSIDGLPLTAKVEHEYNNSVQVGLRYAFGVAAPMAPQPAPTPAPVASPAPTPARTYLVFFDWDKSSLTPRATEIIAEAASDSHTAQTTTIDVSGYTDTSGTPTYNQGLSERRAQAVAAQLVSDGVPMSEIETHAYGETHLLVPTGPGVREPQNRRVEIVLQ